MHQSADEVVWAEALFTSDLQPFDPITPATVQRCIDAALRRDGPKGCAERMAYEFGEHPDTAPRRMCWARRLVRTLPPVRPDNPPAGLGEGE